MKITIEIDDDEIRRLLAPLAQQVPTPLEQTTTRLLNVREVADRLLTAALVAHRSAGLCEDAAASSMRMA